MNQAPYQVASRFLALGLSVIPVPRPRAGVSSGKPGDGKTPALKWKKYQTTLPTVEEIRDWFARVPMNVGVVTGELSGVVVVDADTREAQRWAVRHLPYTPWQTETARGLHLWYRHPGVPVVNRARFETGAGCLAVDVRGDGGFVIAPGSTHASGVEYREAGDWQQPRDRIPVFSAGWLERHGGAPRTRRLVAAQHERRIRARSAARKSNHRKESRQHSPCPTAIRPAPGL